MEPARLLPSRQWLPDISGEAALRRLPSAKTFRRLLAREGARADRLGDNFSLLSLGVNDWWTGRATLLRLAKILRRRLRATDEAGWLDRRHLGIILPGTPAWGAWTLADDLCRSLPEGTLLPECKVFSYPADWMGAEETRAGPLGVRRRMAVRRRPVTPVDLLLVQAMPLWKRALDVVVSALALVLLAPPLAVVAAAVKLSAPGPVFFAQRRSGLGGKPFVLYKFRSMVVDAEARKRDLLALNQQDGPAFKLRADPRVTRLGRFLRATSIDELPQFWNVLRGDMSLVGPRPLPCDESDACRGWQRRRLDVTPGLTCIWQVKGRSRVTFAEWVRMDLRYIGARSPWSDLKLLLQTVPALLLRKGW
jgi:lipopolysaccharide/colanic/teichoic acid biosynthesis glycosyltransferase